MALETLRGVKEINGEKVVCMDDLRVQFPGKFNDSGSMDYKWFESEIRPNNFIYVRHDVGSISFTIQSDPIGEVGKNGCQHTELIGAALLIIKGLNDRFPCRENAITITKLEEALMWQNKRTENRIARNVEGFNLK